MKKGKWSGFDLVRQSEGDPQPPTPAPTRPASPPRRGLDLVRDSASARPPTRPPKSSSSSTQEPLSHLGRIRTRRVMRGPDGEVYDLTKRVPVWLVQLDDINQIFLVDSLKSYGYDVEECARLDALPARLAEAQEPPKLIVIEARAVGQQTPFFRKVIWPQLQAKEIPCLLTGVANKLQENSFRQWYEGPMLVGGDTDAFVEAVRDLIGPGVN